jgi:bifunctional UDP-N-acetylglucosamine pyrophosphorylase / glucosamine-1-phosphate N-acetyltransferase
MPHVVILAAGKGTRMKSDLPKVLHPVNGVPIIQRLLENISSICQTPTIIVGHKAEEVKAATNNAYHYIVQKEIKGTGSAIQSAREELKDKNINTVIVLPGDHPCIRAGTLIQLLSLHEQNNAAITLGTAVVPHFVDEYSVFSHWGRIIRNENGTVEKIVEYKDATDVERSVREVNVSYYCFNAKWLWDNIFNLSNNNAAGEYYLTDMIGIARSQNKIVAAYPLTDIIECMGINTPEQLQMIEQALLV